MTWAMLGAAATSIGSALGIGGGAAAGAGAAGAAGAGAGAAGAGAAGAGAAGAAGAGAGAAGGAAGGGLLSGMSGSQLFGLGLGASQMLKGDPAQMPQMQKAQAMPSAPPQSSAVTSQQALPQYSFTPNQDRLNRLKQMGMLY